MARAYSLRKIFETKHTLVQWGEAWQAAFGQPADTGVWFVWGNSTNGKTRFMLELAVELSKTRKTFYNSLEEGNSHTMQLALKAAGIDPTNKNLLVGCEPVEEMDARLAKRKGPKVAIIDTVQYTTLRFADYLALVKKHPDVLFIFNSQAEGKKPAGKVADRIKFDAALKIWVEGWQAISHGRYNTGGVYQIWHDGADKYGEIELKKTA